MRIKICSCRKLKGICECDECECELKSLISDQSSVSVKTTEPHSIQSMLVGVKGMSCVSCVNGIERTLKDLNGIVSAQVSLLSESAQITFDIEKCNTKDIMNAIDDMGYEVSLIDTRINFQEDLNKITLCIKGMTCASCVSSIEKNISKLIGIKEFDISLMTESANILYDSLLVNEKTIVDSIDSMGYDVSILENKKINKVENNFTRKREITFSDIYDKPLSLKGVVSVVENGNLWEIEYDPNLIKFREIVEYFDKEGVDFDYSDLRSKQKLKSLSREEDVKYWKWMTLFCLTFSLPYFLFSMIFMNVDFVMNIRNTIVVGQLDLGNLIDLLLCIPVQFYGGFSFYKKAISSAKHGQLTMDSLVSIGTFVAFAYSIYSIILSMFSTIYPVTFFDTSISLITFISLGRYLENVAKGKTSTALSKLMNLKPQTAKLYNGMIIDSELLEINDKVFVFPGEKIAADGIVVEGTGIVDESMITGESMPSVKTSGMEVIGGTINSSGNFVFQVTKLGDETTLSKIINAVEGAQRSKASIQQLADRLTFYFVPFIILLGFLTFLFWLTFLSIVGIPHILQSGESVFSLSLRFGISVIVVACPCALGLATPTALLVGTGVGAQHGILIKDGSSLEKASQLSTLLLDKTNTLTIGTMKVENISIFDVHDQDLLLEALLLAETRSEHPLAKSIVEYLNNLNFNKIDLHVSQFESYPGFGIKCSFDNDTNIMVGNLKWLEKNNVNISKHSSVHPILSGIVTRLFVAMNGTFCCVVDLSDRLKSNSKRVIEKLNEMNIQPVMVTGDIPSTAEAVASLCGIETLFSQQTPIDKANIVIEYQNQGKIVGMIGDGINDSPALARSDVGFSVFNGTDIAHDAASIILMNDNLFDLIVAIDLSRFIVARIKWNFAWALAYNFISLPIAAGCLVPFGIVMHPALAGVAMSLSSISVLLSSLAIKLYKPPK